MNSEGNTDGYSYRGGRDDGLGSDDGTRAFPSALRDGLAAYRGNVSSQRIFELLGRDGKVHTVAEAQAINRDLASSLYRDVDIGKKQVGPDGGVEVALGNRWFLDDEGSWRLGTLALLSYDNTWRNSEDESSISTRTNNNFQLADGRQLRDYDIRFEQRELRANQIRGHHVIGLDTRQNFTLVDRD